MKLQFFVHRGVEAFARREQIGDPIQHGRLRVLCGDFCVM
jgi:hypothetical protein